jgi:hypothetical protein
MDPVKLDEQQLLAFLLGKILTCLESLHVEGYSFFGVCVGTVSPAIRSFDGNSQQQGCLFYLF